MPLGGMVRVLGGHVAAGPGVRSPIAELLDARALVYVFSHLGRHREMPFSISLLNLLVKLAAGLTGVAVYAAVPRT